MKKILKNKKGFTLIELMLVVGILVILAAVLLFNLTTYTNRARNAASSLSDHNQSLSGITSLIDEA